MPATTDPELIEYFDNFAFDEVLEAAPLDVHSRLVTQLGALIAIGALGEYRVMVGAADRSRRRLLGSRADPRSVNAALRSDEMAQDNDPAAMARAIIDANLYMVVGTADANGLPWVSPVYYAPAGYREFLWVSSPDSRHSQNIQARPEVGIVIFDSTVPIDTGQGVYMSALAQELDADEVTDRIELFSQRSLGHGGGPFTSSVVRAPSRLRLYRATVLDHYVLETGIDRRILVSP